jgi:hypothetical protein
MGEKLHKKISKIIFASQSKNQPRVEKKLQKKFS